jgi:hypothetical protein
LSGNYLLRAMDTNRHYRPRVSRETRLLLTTALIAVAALWVLARLRFPDQPATPNPVTPLLSQLTPPLTFESLASDVAQVQARLEPSLIALDPRTLEISAGSEPGATRVALRIREDVALTVMQDPEAGARGRNGRILGTDPASGLRAIRVPAEPRTQTPVMWPPRRLERGQFFVVTNASSDRVSFQPVFVATLEPIANAWWTEPIWALSRTDIPTGSFLFTIAGEFVGVVLDYGRRRVVVPSVVALAEASRLSARTMAPAGYFGIAAQSLSPELAAATRTTAGVIVTWVDVNGVASDVVAVGDVIEAIDGRPLPTLEHWRVALARAKAGDTLTLRIRRHGDARDAELRAAARDEPVVRNGSLGLRMRRAAGIGTEVLGVELNSASARAGLAVGDLITFIDGVSSPTPTQVRAAFSAAPEGTPTLVAVTRGPTHLVTTLSR